MSTHPLSNELENQAIPVCNRADKIWNTKVTKGTMAIGINGVLPLSLLQPIQPVQPIQPIQPIYLTCCKSAKPTQSTARNADAATPPSTCASPTLSTVTTATGTTTTPIYSTRKVHNKRSDLVPAFESYNPKPAQRPLLD